jgi:hypothetical protein
MLYRQIGMKCAKRLETIEGAGVFASPRLLLARLAAALECSTLRITGKRCKVATAEEAVRERILADLQECFVRKLSDAELGILIEEYRRIVYGNNTQQHLRRRSGMVSEEKKRAARTKT